MWFIDPPAITAMEFTKVCTNDFTVSWTADSNEEGLSYGVTISSLNINADLIMDTSHNFTELKAATSYEVSIFSRINTCLGIPDTTMVTTLTVEAGVPQGELIVVAT